ncbi:hypothetical protein [Emticicia soli]|uniref:Vitellogenin II n=1 Tax=Emticicia soli TaxID=2027878 RepID=A0ABW5JBR8_9BACT
MNTLKSFRYLSVAVLLGTWGCSQKQVATKGDYDDLYGSSKDAPQVTYKTSTQPSNIYQNPDYTDNLRYQREETPVQAEGTDEYFDENYVNSRKVQRSYSAEPGYSSGFSDGYQSGWNDYAWSQPVGWASPFNRFGYNSPFGFNSWNSWGGFNSFNIGFGLGYGFGNGWGGWGNRFYDPFWGGGFYNPYYAMYSPWGMGGWGSPWGFSPYDYYGYGGYGGFGGFGGYYGYPRYIYNVTSGVDGLARTRTYGPRDGGRASGVYNDRFNNTAVRNVENARRGDANARSYSGSGTGRSYSNSDGYYATPRRNGAGNSSFSNSPNSRSSSSSSSSDAYYARPRRNGGYEGSNSARTYDYSRPSSSSSRSSNSWSSGSGNTRSSSRGSDSWSRSPSSNSTWSAPSRSSSSSSSGSVGGSRGGGGSSGGGGSRGPR